MARAFPESEFVGVDYHADSITTAIRRAREAGADNVRFEVATAKDYGGRDFDLVCFMDCLHDLGDPLGALVHARHALKSDGKIMLVEPYAGNAVEENLNPLGRLFYAASAMACTPNSLSQEVGLGLGAQAGELRLRRLAQQAGFRDLRLAARTPVKSSARGLSVAARASMEIGNDRQARNVYVWDDPEAAQRFFTADSRARIAALYGAQPIVEYAELCALVQNSHVGRVGGDV